MAQSERFPFVKSLKACCAMLKTLARAGDATCWSASRSIWKTNAAGSRASNFLTAGRPRLPKQASPQAVIDLARQAARGPFKPALLAFSCSPEYCHSALNV